MAQLPDLGPSINPTLFSALRFGYRLFQRPSPPKQIPSNQPFKKMFKSITILSHALGLLITAACGASAAPKPNIVYILADDLGYGDVRLLNPQGKIPTPHMDRLGAGGMILTDAHSTSSVCTPSRYSILTGRYNWRSSQKWGVLNGYSPRLIENGRMTVADFLKENGYHTACIGKWHVGMNWPQNDGKAPGASSNPEKVVYDQPVPGGPTSVGFDRIGHVVEAHRGGYLLCFCIVHHEERVNRRVDGKDDGKDHEGAH